jgi:hypothetical protein
MRFFFLVAVFLAPGLLFGCFFSSSTQTLQSEGSKSRAPIVWGMLSGCKGCVIFKENKKTDVGFYVVAVTTKTQGELEVIESLNYDLQPKKWLVDQKSLDELQRRAMKDGLRYVKIMENYTPDELETARAICQKPIANN